MIVNLLDFVGFRTPTDVEGLVSSIRKLCGFLIVVPGKFFTFSHDVLHRNFKSLFLGRSQLVRNIIKNIHVPLPNILRSVYYVLRIGFLSTPSSYVYLLWFSLTLLKVILLYQSPISQITYLHRSAPNHGKFALGYHDRNLFLVCLFVCVCVYFLIILISLPFPDIVWWMNWKTLVGVNQKWGHGFFLLSYYCWQLYHKRLFHIMQIYRYSFAFP